MFDGMTFYVPIDKIIGSKILNFTTEGAVKTANYKGLHFKCINNSICQVRGSLHKYSNEGKHNYNDLSLSSFKKAVCEFCSLFELDPDTIKVTRLEFGVNLDISIDVMEFMGFIIQYKNNIPTNQELGIVFKLTEYKVKLYCKKLVNRPNRLRIELAVNKQRKRQQIIKGSAQFCSTLRDLMNSNICKSFATELSKIFEQIVIIDKNTMDYSGLTPQDTEKLMRGISPFYWKKEWGSRQSRSYQLKIFLSIIEQKGNNKMKGNIADLLKQKCDTLIDIDTSSDYNK